MGTIPLPLIPAAAAGPALGIPKQIETDLARFKAAPSAAPAQKIHASIPV
jgi:hypothetical protein